jgi:hypothetical protein
MATVVMLRHPRTGIVKQGFFGFSWTTSFFGGFPALFRGDFIMGLVFIVLGLFTWNISGIILAFFYNKQYTLKLIEQGYELADSDALNSIARSKLGMVDVRSIEASPMRAESRF